MEEKNQTALYQIPKIEDLTYKINCITGERQKEYYSFLINTLIDEPKYKIYENDLKDLLQRLK